jgi:hypothetical protein
MAVLSSRSGDGLQPRRLFVQAFLLHVLLLPIPLTSMLQQDLVRNIYDQIFHNV